MNDVVVREYWPADFPEWVRMRSLLWPEIAAEDADEDAQEWTARADAVVLVAARPDGQHLCGFAEVGERAFADGCNTAPVAYLEGWYVDADVRGQGVGRKLMDAVLEWARKHGYKEIASDALLENTDSQRAHQALRFEEVERAVRYRRRLD